MYWFPKSKMGKVSFWLGISSFALLFIQYWISMLFHATLPIPIGFLTVICMLVAGILSVIALVRRQDHAILLFVPALFGLLGLFFVLGELIFQH